MFNKENKKIPSQHTKVCCTLPPPHPQKIIKKQKHTHNEHLKQWTQWQSFPQKQNKTVYG